MPQARRHHYVSQFYLKNFVADRNVPRLLVVDLPGGKNYIQLTANVAFENDFHTVTAPGHPRDIIETQLSRFESEVAPALARIIENASLSNADDAGYLLSFASLLLLKSPTRRNMFESAVGKLMKQVGRSYARDAETWKAHIQDMIADGDFSSDVDVEGLRQAVLSEDYEIGLSTDAHLQTEFVVAEQLFELFAKRGWNIYKAMSGQFVTCDRPVVLMWDDPMRTDPVGLGLRGSRVLFALSSEIAICGGFELQNRALEIDANEVAKINGRIILHANRQVYARDDTFEYLLPHNGRVCRGRHLKDDEFANFKATMFASSRTKNVPRAQV